MLKHSTAQTNCACIHRSEAGICTTYGFGYNLLLFYLTTLDKNKNSVQFLHHPSPPIGSTAQNLPESPHCLGFTVTIRHPHTQYDSSRRVTGPPQKPVPRNTQHTQDTNIYDASETRTGYPSKRALDCAPTGIDIPLD